MDNLSQQDMVENIISGVTSGVVNSIEDKFVHINKDHEIFHKNMENILKNLGNVINIAGDVKKALVVSGNFNRLNTIKIYLNVDDKYKNNSVFQTELKDFFNKIDLPNTTIDEVCYNLYEYKKTNDLSCLKKARHLWLEEFIYQIDLFSKKDTFQYIQELDKIRNNFSLNHYKDINEQFVENSLNIDYLISEIEDIREKIKILIESFDIIIKDVERKK